MNTMTLGLAQRQQQTLSPRLQRAVRLLQLSSLDFAQEVKATLGDNPFLEFDENDEPLADEQASDAADGEPWSDPGAPAGDALAPAATSEELSEALDARQVQDDVTAADADGAADLDSERESWQADGVERERSHDGADGSALDGVAVDGSLREHLHTQLNVLPLPPRDLLLAKSLVESLDDDGYLRMELAELADIVGLEPRASDDELQIALRRVQSLDPAGVGARTVQECVLLQLDALADPRQRALARRIVAGHLNALAGKDLHGIARALGEELAVVELVCDRIRRLDPRPGWRFGAAPLHHVTPDVVVRRVRGVWTASLNPVIVPKVRLNHVYAEMFHRQRAAHDGPLAAHLQEARWTVRNVEQRFATILSVAQAIVKRQRRFFDHGPMAMKPLGLREIAEEVGVHESTVSRVTNNKYMATPAGLFELKYFFSRVMPTASGGACSGTAIRGLVKELIDAETPGAPLSDAHIARELAQQGLVVARRTVTKYRQLMRIEPVEQRRRSALPRHLPVSAAV